MMRDRVYNRFVPRTYAVTPVLGYEQALKIICKVSTAAEPVVSKRDEIKTWLKSWISGLEVGAKYIVIRVLEVTRVFRESLVAWEKSFLEVRAADFEKLSVDILKSFWPRFRRPDNNTYSHEKMYNFDNS